MMASVVTWVGGLLQAVLIMFLPMIGPLLHPDDQYRLRYYAAVMRVMRPVMHRVFMLLRPNDGRTIKELLFDKEGYSQTKYKKCFNENDRNKLDNNEPSEDFDVTLLYKLLQLICGLADTKDVKWSDPGTLENSLKRMKDHRNTLAHEDISFSFDELRQHINEMEELCRNVLVFCGLRSRQLITADVANLEKGMEEVLLVKIDLWEPYREALGNLRSKQTSVLVREGRSDIIKLSKRLRILNPFAWLLDIDYSHLDVKHTFTELAFEGYKKIEMQELLIDGNEKIKMQELLETRMLYTGELPDSIIIAGSPGMGKTSLSRFLVHDWLSTNPVVQGLENVELLLPIELRHVYSHDVEHLVKDEVLPSVCKHLQNEDILSTLRNLSLIWVLDGYDEATVKTKQVIQELLKKFPNSRVLITTRTECKDEIENELSELHRSHMSVDLKGFSKDNAVKCTKKLIDVHVKKDVVEKQNAYDRFMKFSQDYDLFNLEIFTVPLFLTMIVVLWLDDPDKLRCGERKSVTFLYSLIVDLIVKKMIVRESFQTLNQRKSQLEKKVNIFLDELGKVLWKDESRLTLQEYEVYYLEEKCSQLGLPFKDVMSAFFVFAEKQTPIKIKEEYTIIHQTIATFLTARAFCNEMISKGWDVMTVAGEWFKTARETLVQHEVCHRHLSYKFDCANLKMDDPEDVDIKICNKLSPFYDIQYFYKKEFCVCINKSSDYDVHHDRQSSYIKSNIYKCHIKDHISNPMIIGIIGYLSFKQELNQERSEQLAFICFNPNEFCGYDFYLSCINEAGNNLFTQKLLQPIKELTWAFTSRLHLESAKQLLQHVQPQSVFIHYCYDITGVNAHKFLLECINTIVNIPVNIHLDLRNFLPDPKSHLSSVKIYLETILDESKCSQLVSLMSPLDGETLKLLENVTSLRELRMVYCGDDLQQVKNLVKQSSQLEHLSIAIYPKSYMGLELSSLIAKDRNLSTFTLVLLDSLCLDPQVLGATAGKLCPDLSHIILHGNLAKIMGSSRIFSADSLLPDYLLTNSVALRVKIVEYISAYIKVITDSLIHLDLVEFVIDVPTSLHTHIVHAPYMFSETLTKQHHVMVKFHLKIF